MDAQNLQRYIKDYPDFPKKDVIFRDISPLLADPEAFSASVNALIEKTKYLPAFNKIVAIDARGFIFASVIAQRLHIGLVLCRKPSRLPGKLVTEPYGYEYSSDSLSIQLDAIKAGESVLIIDDVLASGNTALAAYKAVTKLGGKVSGILCLLELEYLHGRQFLEGNIKDVSVQTVLSFKA